MKTEFWVDSANGENIASEKCFEKAMSEIMKKNRYVDFEEKRTWTIHTDCEVNEKTVTGLICSAVVKNNIREENLRPNTYRDYIEAVREVRYNGTNNTASFYAIIKTINDSYVRKDSMYPADSFSIVFIEVKFKI